MVRREPRSGVQAGRRPADCYAAYKRNRDLAKSRPWGLDWGAGSRVWVAPVRILSAVGVERPVKGVEAVLK